MDSRMEALEVQRETLHRIIDDAADLVVTFDGRLSFVPTTSDGRCVVSFTTRQSQTQLTIFAVMDDSKRVTLSCSTTAGSIEIVYQDIFDAKLIRNQLNLKLAHWYGTVIRSLPVR